MKGIEDFQNYLAEQNASPLTVRGYTSDMVIFIRWFAQANNEDFSPEVVTPSDIREYKKFLQVTERRKTNTINRKLASISAFMSWAIESGRIQADPTSKIKLLRQQEHAPRYLNKTEQFALQRAIEKELQLAKIRFPKRWRARQRDAAFVNFLLHTGLRLNEALNLHLDDVQMSERKANVTVWYGKGGKSRTVPLNATARKALQSWLAVRPERRNDYLWVAVENESDSALTGRAVQRVLVRIGQEAGLERLSPHILRHSFAKNLLDSGVGLEKVAELLGHKNLNTTRIYGTPNQKDLEQAVSLIE